MLGKVGIEHDEPERVPALLPVGQVKRRAQVGVLPHHHQPSRVHDGRQQPERRHRPGRVAAAAERPGGHAPEVGLRKVLEQHVHRRRAHRPRPAQHLVGQLDGAGLHSVNQPVERRVHGGQCAADPRQSGAGE